jgi:hypothetical protein
MAQKPDPKEMVSLQELLMAQMVQIDTIFLLLVEKGVFTQ